MSKLTKTIIDNLETSKRIHIWDSQIKGFGVRVSSAGRKTYILKYRAGGGRAGQQRWLTLGTHGSITCEQAREKAVKLLAEIADGKDPQKIKFDYREAPKTQDLWDKYEKEHLPTKKPKSQEEDIRNWKNEIAPKLANKKIKDVNRQDIEKILLSFKDRPYLGNRVYALISKMMNLAEYWEFRNPHSNPCLHVKKYKEEKRERYLNKAELEKLGEVLSFFEAKSKINLYTSSAIKLLLLTGARVSEILTAKWEWVDWEKRTINLPDSKTGKKPLFLSSSAIDILNKLKNIPEIDDNPYIIRGFKANSHMNCISKAWQRIRKEAGIEDVRIHDLRHTVASIAVGQGANLPIIGRLLGHSQVQTTQRYAHVDVDPALAVADKLGETIASSLNKK